MIKGFSAIVCLFATASVAIGSPEGDPAPAAETTGPRATTALPEPLPFFYDLYTFRGDGGETDVVAAVAVPVSRLGSERENRRVQYRFDVRFVLADTLRRTVFRSLDSVYVARARPLPRQHLLHTHVEIEAPPSTSMVQRVIVTDATRPGVGQLYDSPYAIPDYSGSELMLSDVALGLPGRSVGWTRGDVTLALLPTSQFPESSFDVYYEVYNLPTGTPYDTEIAITPLDDDDEGDRTVRARFSGESSAAEDGTLAELRHVASSLDRGRYRLTVTVRDMISGATASRSRVVDVQRWRRGTTMVPALPRGLP